MKKLLSICFLSILLGLLSFSTRAQGGFWIENMQPDTIFGVANYSPNNDGKLPLTHTLGNAFFNQLTGNYVGNAYVGKTELYKLNLCDWAGKTKLSIDWQLYRDGQLVNDDLSSYVEFSIYTLYRKLNVSGNVQSIHWLGGRVVDGFGTCTTVPAPDMFSSATCDVPTNYPGALQVGQGTPYSVMTQLGQIVPAQGLFAIYSEALDYFYADFLQQTDNYVQIKWLQPGNYTLVMSIRERLGGTDWNNLTWNDNETTDFIGGHQSCCGEILASDTLTFPALLDLQKAVCENVSWDFGRPTYTFNAPVGGVYPNVSYDTMIVFGEVKGTGSCTYFHTDSLYNVDFFVRHTPVATAVNATLCKCETMDNILGLVTVDTNGLSDTQSSYVLQWGKKVVHIGGPATIDWQSSIVAYDRTVNSAGDTIYTYMVRQINTYDDTLDCVGPAATFTVTFKEMLAPQANIPAVVDFCREAVDSTTVFSATATLQDTCGKTTRWYTTLKQSPMSGYNYYTQSLPIGNTFTSYIDTASFIPGADLSVNLKDYLPATNHDTTIYFFVTSYDPTTGCESPKFDYFMVNIHQTPELSEHIIKTVYCPSDEVEMWVTVINSPDDTDNPYTYLWTGVTSIDDSNAVAMPASLNQEVELSKTTLNGTAQTGAVKLPFYANNGKNWSEQIFTPAEVPAGVITKMAFNYNTSSALTKKASNVEIYMATTDKNAFASKADFVTTGLVLVYSGSMNATQGWNEFEFTTPYTYTGEKNLVLIVKDNSGTTQTGRYFSATKTTDNKAILISLDGTLPVDPTTYTGSVNLLQYRNDVKFTVAPMGQATTNKFQYAYNQLDPTLECGHVYTTTAMVIDSNGCKSNPVTFTYVGNDTIAPVVAPLARENRVSACAVSAANTKSYKTLNDLITSGVSVTDDAVEVGDNCGFPYLTMTYDSVFYHGTCEDTLVFTYTITDKCGKTAQFKDTFISRDSIAPEFINLADPMHAPYVRLYPVPAGNCQFNSPDSMTFVNAVAPFVHDNCTDSAYLMSTLSFNWENIAESPINATNIFYEKNHLTVTATITDKCGLTTTSLVIFLDRPDQIKITPNAITSSGNLCFKDTLSLGFLVSHIVDDTIMGPFTPYSFAWSELNGKPVNFSNVNGIDTKVTFPEAGDYVFVMTVTDNNGCTAVSQPVTVNVRPLPQMALNHIVINGQTEPYCPTYGNLTMEAVQLNHVTGQSIVKYEWSGESVNIYSTSDTSWVTIIPEWCDTLYYPTVTVTDERGCVGSVTDTVEVASQGPEFIGTLADTTVQKQPGCVFLIPDFKNLINANIVKDECYSFSQLKYSDAYGMIERTDWYSQSPAAGDTLTESSKVVTITITNPCGRANQITVNVLKPSEVLSVSIVPTDTAECQEFINNSGVIYTATPSNAFGTVTYEWTVNDNTTVLGVDPSYEAKGAMDAGKYTYRVDIMDQLGCTASATADLTVYYQGADPYTRTWPNTLCDRFNGMLAVDTAPCGYSYLLTHQVYGHPQLKISDVCIHDTNSTWETIVFDSLRPGTYDLLITTDHGCQRMHQVTITDSSSAPAAPTFVINNVTVCTNDNGILNINANPNFTYELYRYDGDVKGALLGTATSYNNLSVGKYLIHSTDNATKCIKDTTFTLIDNAPRPIPAANSTANNNCDNAGKVYTGTITVTTSPNWKYTVYSATDTLIDNEVLTSANHPVTGLRQGMYFVEAYDPSTGCRSLTPDTVNVGYTAIPTALTATATPNNFCTADTANGTIKITSDLSNLMTFNLVKATGAAVASQADYNNGWGSLYAGAYLINATNKYYCPVTSDTVKVNTATVNPMITATSTINGSCVDNLGTITLKNTNAAAHMASYKIAKGADETLNTSTSNTVTFNNLASGTYSYLAKTVFGCTASGNVTVDQYQLPAMDLDSTPNHMCHSTFEKPGDGTVIINVPTNTNPGGASSTVFEYKFYDAAGHEMTVPYDLPLTHTKYWLSAQQYKVTAYEPSTGCTVTGYITVEDSLYTVDFDYNTTPNFYCDTTTGNGTITVINPTSTNPDAVFNYSLDDVNYTSNNVFTGLKTGTYTVYVKDTLMLCVKAKSVIVNTTDSCAPVVTICDNKGACGNKFDYCYGEEGVKLTATAVDTCNGASFSFEWVAPCASPSYSDSASIMVQTDHYVVNGCDYILTVTNNLTGCKYPYVVNVATHPIPQLSFLINGVPADILHSNTFCEQKDLHISLVSDQPLDTASVTWTLGILGTGFTDFHVKGDTITDKDSITYCVYADSKYGCRSLIASLPVNFFRVDSLTVPVQVCESYLVPGGSTVTKPASKSYPYDTVVVMNYSRPAPKCDSVVTYNIRLIAAPEITPATVAVAPFCESEVHTLADFVDSFNVVNNGGTVTTNWMAATASDVYTLVTDVADLTDGNYIIAYGDVAMSHTLSSGKFEPAPRVLASPSSSIVWTITKSGSNYNISNGTQYVSYTGGTNLEYSTSGVSSKALWSIDITSGNASIRNNYSTSRYLRYNTQASGLCFRAYTNSSIDCEDVQLYKQVASSFTSVPATTVVDYAFASTHAVKYVASNECGSNESVITFDVSKKPAIDTFDVKNSYCYGTSCDIAFQVSSFGHPANVKLMLDTFELVNTVINGENVDVTANFTSSYKLHNNKPLVLTVSNVNGLCGDTVATKIIKIDSFNLDEILVAPAAYCAGDMLTYADFHFTTASNPTAQLITNFHGAVADSSLILSYTDNNMQVYFTIIDACGNTLESNKVNIKVNDKPDVPAIANVEVCADAFALTEPIVTFNGGDSLSSGWLMQTAVAGVYAPATPNQIKEAARDSVVNAAFYAQNTCGYDTAKFTVTVNDKPEAYVTSGVMCPNASISSVIVGTPVYHHINGDATTNKAHFEIAKSDGSDRVVLNTSDYFSAYYPAYQGGKIYYIVENGTCGSDTAEATITILYNDFSTFTFKPACIGGTLSDFIDTLPVWKGTAPVAAYGWTVGGANVDPATTIVTAPITVGYYWKTTCGDSVATAEKTLTNDYLFNIPTVSIDPTIEKCDGDSLTLAETNLNITYHGNDTLYQTTWTLDGADYDFTAPLTYADSGKALVVSVGPKVLGNGACGTATDTMIVKVNALPNVNLTGPSRVCENVDTTFKATPGYVNYEFSVSSTLASLTATPSTQNGSDSNFTTQFNLGGISGVGKAMVTVLVTDAKGCKATASLQDSVIIKNIPQFDFFYADSTENASHHYNAHTGQPLSYVWRVGTQCNFEDKLVYVEYDIYHNDTLITNAAIGQYLDTKTTYAHGTTQKYVTKNTIKWLSGSGDVKQDSAFFNFAIANPTTVSAGNHFPNVKLGVSVPYVFDDLWMHFLGDRMVEAKIVPFKLNGDYKIVYRLYATDNIADFNNVYNEDNPNHPNYGSSTQHIGGHNSLVGPVHILAIDSITIHVDGENLAPTAVEQHETPAPEVAPMLTMEETNIVPDMEVWPNPAPAVTTTLKARVHNMSGNATVTLTNLTGKQVYNGNVYIDNDNFYFEFNVNSLSIGSYIMTVRTATDVITKKVIVTALAR